MKTKEEKLDEKLLKKEEEKEEKKSQKAFKKMVDMAKEKDALISVEGFGYGKQQEEKKIINRNLKHTVINHDDLFR